MHHPSPGISSEVSMAAPVQTSSAFPSPYEIGTPPGCEGWEEMYPYHALFAEARREADENRFWFWNSMHFPVPMPAFDVACIDSPYQAVGAWQNRVFAVPPAMGIDYRIVNGYVYISGNRVTAPARTPDGAASSRKPPGPNSANGAGLNGKGKGKVRRRMPGLEGPEGPRW